MFFVFANPVFAPMIERILLIQQGSSWGGVLSVRVLLIDDSKAVVHELRSLLSLNPGWLVCGGGENGVKAVEKARSLRPDLVLMDISMPQMNGIEATRIIRRQVPESAVILSVRMIR